MGTEHFKLWNEDVTISSSENLSSQNQEFPLYHVQASDDTEALLMLCETQLETEEKNLESVISNQLQQKNLQPSFIDHNGHRFLSAVWPIHQQLIDRFGEERIGINILINGEEAGDGTLPLDEMHVEKGEKLQILYRISQHIEKRLCRIFRRKY
jgi:hypothetical protein